LGEESDDLDSHDSKKALSHFELYLQSMDEIGADIKPIEKFVARLDDNMPWEDSLKLAEKENPRLPKNTFEFV
jgi:uncharacterized UPF0160 family protein